MMNIVEYLIGIYSNNQYISYAEANSLFSSTTIRFASIELKELLKYITEISKLCFKVPLPCQPICPKIDNKYYFEYIPYIYEANSFCQMLNPNHILISTKFTGCALAKFKYKAHNGKEIYVGAHIYAKHINDIQNILKLNSNVSDLCIQKADGYYTSNFAPSEAWVTIGPNHPKIHVFEMEKINEDNVNRFYHIIKYETH